MMITLEQLKEIEEQAKKVKQQLIEVKDEFVKLQNLVGAIEMLSDSKSDTIEIKHVDTSGSPSYTK